MDKKPIKISLLPAEMVEISSSRKKNVLKTVSVFVFLAFVFSAIGLTGMFFWSESQTNKINELDFGIKQLQANINLSEDIVSKSNDLKKKISLVDSVLDNHLYWTKLLELLENKIVPSVYFTKISANKNSGVEISAVGLDFESAARQYLALREDKHIKNISISSFKLQNGKPRQFAKIDFPDKVVAFTMNIEINPDVLIYQKD